MYGILTNNIFIDNFWILGVKKIGNIEKIQIHKSLIFNDLYFFKILNKSSYIKTINSLDENCVLKRK